MEFQDMPFHRLHAQHISHSRFKYTQELVSHLGALQAQDFYMVKWALGIRMPGTKNEDIEKAMDKGDILRTHLLRPTWHLVSSDDIYWLLDLTSPHLKTLLKPRHKELELTKAILIKSQNVIEKILQAQKQATREQLVTALEKANIITTENRASHLLFTAELEGLICSGTGHTKSSTYALLDERVPKAKRVSKEEALSKLALIYFKSRGPATLKDFINWSSLPKIDARKGWETAKSKLATAKIGDQEYGWDDSLKVTKKETEEIYLLPAFDEYIIGYKDRTAVLAKDYHKTAVSVNGIFWPTIVHKGHVVGIWKRTLKKGTAFIETHFFKRPTASQKIETEKAATAFGTFLDLNVEVEHKN